MGTVILISLLSGIVLGTPIGIGLISFLKKNKCKESSCDSKQSSLCIDGLCPTHCKQVHGTKCLENY